MTPAPARKSPAAKAAPRRRWSQAVTEHSDALDLEGGVFAQKDPKRIAASLKRSAERSDRKKSSPFRSAMSMLTFYLNRAGRNLPTAQRRRVETAKAELRKLFGKAGPTATERPAATARPRAKAPARKVRP